MLADPNYILVGNSSGIAIPSPILIDIRLDLIDLQRGINTTLTTDFIIGHPNSTLTNAQALSILSNGIMLNTAGIVSSNSAMPIDYIADLTSNNIWIGDSMNRPVANPIITLNNLPNLTFNKIWIGNFANRPIEGDPIPGVQGPQGSKGPRGFPGLGFTAIAKAIFDAIFGDTLGDLLGNAAGKLFDAWLDSLLAGTAGRAGLVGLVGTIGLVGLAGLKGGSPGNAGLPGAAGKAGVATHQVIVNYDLAGNRLTNISPSPLGDYDAVTTKWVWDLLHDNVEIIWE